MYTSESGIKGDDKMQVCIKLLDVSPYHRHPVTDTQCVINTQNQQTALVVVSPEHDYLKHQL